MTRVGPSCGNGDGRPVAVDGMCWQCWKLGYAFRGMRPVPIDPVPGWEPCPTFIPADWTAR